jgi:N-acyl amino acid synthase of PEP-CTERM/exosortase system
VTSARQRNAHRPCLSALVSHLRRFSNTHPIDFLRYFDISAAVSDEQFKRAAQLRHQVYCEEMGYEPPVATRLETDHHDAHALHCLITHKASGRTAGCVRLICATDHALLALEENCLHSLHVGYLQQLNWHREQSFEMSRLAVDPVFRRKRGLEPEKDSWLHAVETDDDERHTFHLVWLAVLFAAVAMADTAGRTHLYAMMDPKMPRLLRRAGVHLKQAGDFTQYHGERAAFFITTEDSIAHLSPGLRELFDAIKAQYISSEADQLRLATA